MTDHIDAWKEVYDAFEPHTVAFPGTWRSLHEFQRLMIISCLRPDKVS